MMDAILSNKYAAALLPMAAGCCFIFVCSLVKVPFYPVPMTMHTFAIFYLGLMQSPRNACGSALLYLAAGTLNPSWMIGKCGGYFLSFPIAAYLISWSVQKISPYLAILAGQGVIYSLGFLWLVPFVGIKIAFLKGVLFFLPSAVVKAALAVKLAEARS
ncbi:biotin transporter BioY [Waddlia chondrophila]|nr:biotin transporter BioY [Waddlia chondrophila]